MQELFFQGKYKQVLAETVDSRSGAFAAEDVAYVIGALTFRGRLHEADHLYQTRRGGMDEEALVVSRFFLGVGYCRHSHYAKARQMFGANLRWAGGHACGRLRFFAWQGVGFYRLFCGRHLSGFRAAQRALTAALEANFLYGKALAADLTAHNQVFPGQISAALASFRDAIRYAELLGDGGLLQAFQVSLAIHSAQHGLSPATDEAELRRLCNVISAEDNYSQARLLLELGRQLTLRGDVAGAKATLNEACQMIYSANNRRYSVQLNLRYAYLMHLAGEHHQALNLVRNAAKELAAEVDRTLRVEVLGLERRLLATLGLPENPDLLPTLQRLGAQTGGAVAARILKRDDPAQLTFTRIGDDPLGDLLDLARIGGADAGLRIVEKGFYGVLMHLVPGAAGRRLLYFDLVPGSLVVMDRGQVRYAEAGFSSVIRAIAKVLQGGEATKQDLIEKVWGYKYQSLKHDPLIYRNISRFRVLLDAAAVWLEVTESGYRLADGVEVRFHQTEGLVAQGAHLSAAAPSQDDPSPRGNVNYRQLKMLEHLEANEYLDVKVCVQLLGISEITARRDLSHLLSLALLERVGKGRATRYVARV